MATTYKWLRIDNPIGHGGGIGIIIQCSDESVIQWLEKEALIIVPTAKIEYINLSLVSNKPFGLSIKKLNNNDYAFALNMVQLVCENGWKPLIVQKLEYSWDYEFVKEIST